MLGGSIDLTFFSLSPLIFASLKFYQKSSPRMPEHKLIPERVLPFYFLAWDKTWEGTVANTSSSILLSSTKTSSGLKRKRSNSTIVDLRTLYPFVSYHEMRWDERGSKLMPNHLYHCSPLDHPDLRLTKLFIFYREMRDEGDRSWNQLFTIIILTCSFLIARQKMREQSLAQTSP